MVCLLACPSCLARGVLHVYLFVRGVHLAWRERFDEGTLRLFGWSQVELHLMAYRAAASRPILDALPFLGPFCSLHLVFKLN